MIYLIRSPLRVWAACGAKIRARVLAGLGVFMLSAREFYSVRRHMDLIFYVVALAASAFFAADGLLRIIGYYGATVPLAAVVAAAALLYCSVASVKGSGFAMAGRLKLAVSATAFVSVLVLALVL